MNVYKSKILFSILTIVAALLLISACASIIPDTGNSADTAATQNAQILAAVKGTATTSAMQTQISQLETQVAITPSAVPAEPTATALSPTATLVPTATQVPPTPTPSIPCNQAGFVDDVSIPDGSILSPGMYFSKTWRLKNNGSCTWTTAYDLVFVSGDLLGGPTEQALPGSVAPGQIIDLTVNLTAPSRNGYFRGYWRLRDASGTLFG
ncbi:MAG: hypothetical protein IH586_04210, partial [Anaerolineaceae bacterium]|nr:hypothetical protein [Anaerolineaceae bacterium]